MSEQNKLEKTLSEHARKLVKSAAEVQKSVDAFLDGVDVVSLDAAIEILKRLYSEVGEALVYADKQASDWWSDLEK